MTDYKKKYDIFIAGGSQHLEGLNTLLPKLYPFGRIHLSSITLTELELQQLRPYYDVVHTPRHHLDGYLNFNLFCIRDINRLARGSYFIKLDADVQIRDDWVDYVDKAVEEHPYAVLFGPHQGKKTIDLNLSGPRVRSTLGRDLRVVEGKKVIGGFYVGKTSFFRQHDAVMQAIHELLYCFDPDLRFHPGPYGEIKLKARARKAEDPATDTPVMFKGQSVYDLRKIGDEDTMRCLAVHAVQASDRMVVLDSAGRIQIFPPAAGAEAGPFS